MNFGEGEWMRVQNFLSGFGILKFLVVDKMQIFCSFDKMICRILAVCLKLFLVF